MPIDNDTDMMSGRNVWSEERSEIVEVIVGNHIRFEISLNLWPVSGILYR